MASRANRPPHLGVLAGARELADYAEVTLERARQLTLSPWWDLLPTDYVGGRFVYSYPHAVQLLADHGYPKRLHPEYRNRRTRSQPAPRMLPERKHLKVLAGIGEIAHIAHVPTSRATQMTKEDWWSVTPLDHLAGGTLYPYRPVALCLKRQGYPRVYKTIGEKLEAQAKAVSRRAE